MMDALTRTMESMGLYVGPVERMEKLKVWCERRSSRNVIVRWRGGARSATNTCIRVDDVTDPDENITMWCTGLDGGSQSWSVPRGLEPGHRYHVELSQTVGRRTVAAGRAKFRADFSKRELQQLLDRAEDFVEDDNSFDQCKVFYRNKPESYFEEITEYDDGIMEVYEKDDNGDPASPINGAIDGLFFCVNVHKRTKKPLQISNFGNRRINIPEDYMFAVAPNVYFTDFYCIKDQHYVTLVMASPESEADDFCERKLLPLDMDDNPFLERDTDTGVLYVTHNVIVEVLFTEDIDLEQVQDDWGAWFSSTKTRGVSTPGGLPKNPDCDICNIY